MTFLRVTEILTETASIKYVDRLYSLTVRGVEMLVYPKVKIIRMY